MMVNEISAGSENNSETAVSINLAGATIALDEDDDKSSVCEDDDDNPRFPSSVIPTNTNLNIEGSTDVIVGAVTQFHGPVTIYQNTHNNTQVQNDSLRYLPDVPSEEKNSPTTFSTAKLVASESLSGKPLGNIPFSRKKIAYISLAVMVSVILICVITGLLVGFAVSDEVSEYHGDTGETDPDNKPSQPQLPGRHKLIYRDRWGGRPPLYERPNHVPVKYVIISHTAGVFCDTVPTCSTQMVQIQSLHVEKLNSPDIGYNFVIGGDGNIYVGRGWDAHNFHMKLDTIGICFIGNYIYDTLTAGMIEAAQQLLKYGVDHGKLVKDYVIVGHNQTYNTQSPGANIIRQIKYWPHYSPELLVDTDD